MRLFKTSLFAVCLLASLSAGAQTFTNLHVFSTFAAGIGTNSDGTFPKGAMVLSGNVLYGTASGAGTNGQGVIFSMNVDGSNFTVLHAFAPIPFPTMTNADGASPTGGLILSGNTLYGTASRGGTNRGGTIFSINTDGSQFTVLYAFDPFATDPSLDLATNVDGTGPIGTLCLSGSVLYGTAENGGSNGWGTVFALNTNGSNFNVLYTFSNNEFNDNLDGANPAGGPALINGTLYGTTRSGGANGTGTLFAVNTNGSGFGVLHTFAPLSELTGTNADGAIPEAGLTASGNTLYGTTSRAGLGGGGTVFALEVDNTNFTVEYGLNAGTDGWMSSASLFLAGGTLFGTAYEGGSNSNGTVFSVGTSGSNFTVLHDFAPSNTETNVDGEDPLGPVLLSGSTLYGTTSLGGTNANGTIFALTLVAPPTPIPLSIQVAGTNAILSWTNPAFFLYASPNVTGTYVKLTNAISPFTNPSGAPQQFFRLQTE